MEISYGSPVTGSRVISLESLVVNGYNGLIVPPKDSDALAKAIIQLLNDSKLRNKLGKNARQAVIQRYSWRVVLPRIEAVYYEALGMDRKTIRVYKNMNNILARKTEEKCGRN